MTDLAAVLSRETDLVSQFIAVLKQEQSTLKLGKPDPLVAINVEKMRLVEQLNLIGIERSALADMTGTGTDSAKMTAWLKENPHEKKSASLWVKLLELAQEAKELHQLNGKLISLHLQHTTDAIAVLTHQHREHSLLYGSDGQATAYTGSRIVDSA